MELPKAQQDIKRLLKITTAMGKTAQASEVSLVAWETRAKQAEKALAKANKELTTAVRKKENAEAAAKELRLEDCMPHMLN